MDNGTGALLQSEPKVNITVTVRKPSARLNAVCPYYTMFPLTFPLSALETAEAQATILDPFCGRGTTNFAARLLGFSTFGVDASPIAVAMAKAKLVSTEPETVIHLCEQILSFREPVEVPEGDFWSLGYDPTTLRNICKLREYFLERCETPEEIILRAIVMGILHGPVNKGHPTYLSNQMPRTYASKPASAVRYWEARGMTPEAVDVLDCVRRRAHYVLADVPAPVEGEILLADSATFDYTTLGREFDWIITSPPYLGMVTYVPDQWIRNWFVGGPPDVVYEAGAQLGRGSEVDFTQALRTVWNRVSQASREGAKLVVRFGALPSMPTNPAEVIADSLLGTPWVLREVRPAGLATAGKRQAKQFQFVKNSPIEEVDVHAVLGG